MSREPRKAIKNDQRNESKNRKERNISAVTKVKQNRRCRKSPSSNTKVLKQKIGREAEDLGEIKEFQTESDNRMSRKTRTLGIAKLHTRRQCRQ
jgi:hypothetical protein